MAGLSCAPVVNVLTRNSAPSGAPVPENRWAKTP
jgi:hypothetical protein